MLTRRGFLAALATGGAGLALGGCSAPAWLAPGAWPAPADAGEAIAIPSGREVDLAGHLLARLTFGAAPGDRGELERLGVEAWLDAQLHPERIDDHACERAVRRIELLAEPAGELYEHRREHVADALTRATLIRAATSRRQLFERVAGAWCDHFGVALAKADCAWLAPEHDRRLRLHAFGRFRDLLGAATLSPAMLWYLDGRDNRAGAGERPNENHARELLELHTLGVHGGYTQRDVLEAARCLSGWTVRPRGGWRKGAVEFVPERHDDGEKTVLGARIPAGGGAADVERLLDVLAVHPATARRVAERLCIRFITDAPPAATIDGVAAAFTASGGDLRATVAALLARPELLAEEAGWRHLRGARLKRPLHWVASILRATGAESDAGAPLARHLAALGETPYGCTTPDGYSDTAETWRHGLLWRWKVAADLVAGRVAGTRIDAEALVRRVGGSDRLAAHLLQRPPDEAEREAVRGLAAGDALAVLVCSPGFERC